MNVRSSGAYCYHGTLNNKLLFLNIFEEEIQNYAFVFQYYRKTFFHQIKH